MKLYALALVLMLSRSGFAQEDCTFSSEGQLEILAHVASRYPSGTTDRVAKAITWLSKTGDKMVFGYGGCEDLGSTISISSRMKTPRSREAVFSAAIRLAERFWKKDLMGDDIAIQVFRKSIQRHRLTTEKRNGVTFFNIPAKYLYPNFVEFYIDHRFQDGLDTVEVAYQTAL